MLPCTIISLVLFCIYTYDKVDPHATVLPKRLNCSTADCERHYSNHRVWWLSCKSASALPACQSHTVYLMDLNLVHSNNTRIQPHKTTAISHTYIQPTQSRLHMTVKDLARLHRLHMLFCLVFSWVYWLKSRVLLHCNVSAGHIHYILIWLRCSHLTIKQGSPPLLSHHWPRPPYMATNSSYSWGSV